MLEYDRLMNLDTYNEDLATQNIMEELRRKEVVKPDFLLDLGDIGGKPTHVKPKKDPTVKMQIRQTQVCAGRAAGAQCTKAKVRNKILQDIVPMSCVRLWVYVGLYRVCLCCVHMWVCLAYVCGCVLCMCVGVSWVHVRVCLVHMCECGCVLCTCVRMFCVHVCVCFVYMCRWLWDIITRGDAISQILSMTGYKT